ncbi:pertactin-like passenger domain-containing protein [Rodentibacter myodis]|uniref:Uncharacterized protein n=1 Tax=Rodentibacter myodis TaxID=1907939 RepID=A0A1V3JI60_9PAST|nr:S6 family peptidase [Rodentibacter myodis]OOF56436.1 hypothetical protein BKL49_10650 [Rodentibacter myodis]
MLPKFIQQTQRDDEIVFENKKNNAVFRWTASSGNGSLTERNGKQRFSMQLADSQANEAQGKTLYLSGKNGTIILEQNINQGAGALYFNGNFTVKPQSDQTWLGAGISVATNKQVNWQVPNPKGDRLSKIGQGTLYVNGVGRNLGNLSVGDGKVILAQRADHQGQKQAFNQVGIVSGRPTLVLNDDEQIRGDNLYFGYQGGRLDLNGNTISFTRIQNVDDGAKIVNHNTAQTAYVTVTGGRVLSAKDVEWVEQGKTSQTATALYEDYRNNRPDYYSLKNGQSPTASFPQNAIEQLLTQQREKQLQPLLNEQDIEWGQWSKRTKAEVGLYEYINPHRHNRTDYFILKENGNPSDFFPLDQNSNNSWEYIGGNRQQAIQTVLQRANAKRRSNVPINTAFDGYFGETEANKPNGPLNVIYNTPDDSFHLISGGTNINGKFNVLGGTLLLSGRPQPRAVTYQDGNIREVFSPTEWLNRTFKATNTYIGNDAKLYIGRNVSQVTGNFHLQDNARLQIGVVQGETPQCIRSDYRGNLTCKTNVYLGKQTWESLPTTRINGDVYLKHNAQFVLGKAHYLSTIQAKDNSLVRLTEPSRWTMWKNSQLIHLKMENARVTLNPMFDYTNAQSGVKSYRTLTINGNLSGNGRFDFLTNLAAAQSDRLIVNGVANGRYRLAIKNTGAEPKAVQSLDLVQLNHRQQAQSDVNFNLENGYVDLGAYRYVLRNQNYRYHLYSPLRDAEMRQNDDSQRQAIEAELAQAKQLCQAAGQSKEVCRAIQLTSAEEDVVAVVQAKVVRLTESYQTA